jgi:hypothetical protein
VDSEACRVPAVGTGLSDFIPFRRGVLGGGSEHRVAERRSVTVMCWLVLRASGCSQRPTLLASSSRVSIQRWCRVVDGGNTAISSRWVERSCGADLRRVSVGVVNR